MKLERTGVWLYRAAVAVVFVVFIVGAFHRIASFWQWGHNGYNGAAFAQAARNSLRFDIVGQAQYHTGLNPPQTWEIYTHHPMMLHAHLVGAFALLGDDEWVGRLIPAVYSVLNLLLLFVVVRRLGGPSLALLSIVIYALIPINLIFANMIDHEQGGLFWCIMTIWAWIQWLEGYRWRWMALALVSVTIASQFDWPGYYIAFFIAVHATIVGLMRHRGGFRWRPEYTWITVFSVVVLANFVGFFGWIWLLHGGVEGMQDSFGQRSFSPPGYWQWMWVQTRDLQGIIPVALLCAWLVITFYRLCRWKLEIVDLLPLMFVGVQAIHSNVFKQAGMYHSYWTYWLSPAIAIGGARALLAVWSVLDPCIRRVLLAIGGRFSDRRLAWLVPRVVFASLLVALLVPQTKFAHRQLHWGYNTGCAAYQPWYDDQFAEISWSRALAGRYQREQVHYLVDPSVQGRIEFTYYIDSPLAWVPLNTVRTHGGPRGKQRVVIADLRYIGARAGLARLVMRHKTIVWDRRFVAVELDEPPAAGPQGFVSVAQPMSWAWRWLVNPWRPSLHWKEDPDPSAVANLFDTSVNVTLEPLRGSYGGEPRAWDCPRGQVMRGIGMATRPTPKMGPVALAVRPRCGTVFPTEAPDGSGLIQDWVAPWIGPWLGEPEMVVSCNDGDAPVGIVLHMTESRFVSGLGFVCATPSRPDMELGQGQRYELESPYLTPIIGTHKEEGSQLRCPTGSVVWGFRGRMGELVDAVGISCVALGDGFVDNPATPVGWTPWEWP